MDYALSLDLDWASDDCLEHVLGIISGFGIRPTLFVTHGSAAVRRACAEGRIEIGAHPNFAPDTSQGEGIEEVVGFVRDLAPHSVAVRCHRHLTGPDIEAALARRGFRVDSTTYRHLAADIEAETLPSGLRRLPVFFEDDCHWQAGLSWRFRDHAPAFFTPGLKVLNFHPFFVMLNIPDAPFYVRLKHKITSLTFDEALELRHAGAGAATFLVEMLTALQADGHRFVTLSELGLVGAPTAEAPRTRQ